MLEPDILVFINKLRNILELDTGTSKKLTKIFDKIKYLIKYSLKKIFLDLNIFIGIKNN